MEAYLIDTMFASALWDEGDVDNASALDFVTRAANLGDLIYVSRISLAEIEYGYKLYVSTQPERRAKAEIAMRAFKAIRDVGAGTTEYYSDIRAALFTRFAPRDSKGRIRSVRPERLIDQTTGVELGIQENDLWIASIAAESNMTLVSGDRMSHIKEVYPRLKFVPWKSPASPP
jgi:tRNA(fMet)-specific endonuclease VapC